MRKLRCLAVMSVVGCVSFDVAAAQERAPAPTRIDPAALAAASMARPGMETGMFAARGSATPAASARIVDVANWPAANAGGAAAGQNVSGGSIAGPASMAPRGDLPATRANINPSTQQGALKVSDADAQASGVTSVERGPPKVAAFRTLTVAPAGGAQPAAKAMESMSAKKPSVARPR